MKAYVVLVLLCGVMAEGADDARRLSGPPAPRSVEALPIVKIRRADREKEPSPCLLPVAITNETDRPFVCAVTESGHLRCVDLLLSQDGRWLYEPRIMSMQIPVRREELRVVQPGQTLIATINVLQHYLELEPGTYTVTWGLAGLGPDLTQLPSGLELKKRMVVIIE